MAKSENLQHEDGIPVSDARRRLGVKSVWTVHNMVRRGELVGWRIYGETGPWRISLKSVNAIVAAREQAISTASRRHRRVLKRLQESAS